MTGRIIKNPEGWAAWGPITDNTTIVDDYEQALQYDHWTWYKTADESDTATKDLDYPVEIVWAPADRDLLTWPEETP